MLSDHKNHETDGDAPDRAVHEYQKCVQSRAEYKKCVRSLYSKHGTSYDHARDWCLTADYRKCTEPRSWIGRAWRRVVPWTP
jgi:hypothetical protein